MVRADGAGACAPSGTPERPLAVVTAPALLVLPETRESYLRIQRELANLSGDSTRRLLEGASHIATMTDPEAAREVVEGVRGVVRKARASQ